MKLVWGLLLLASVTLSTEVGAQTRDYGALNCGAFLASGQANMAVIIWWLRGHHAGKAGVDSFDPQDDYARRLGFYCRNHPNDNLIKTSERILTDLDRGI